MSNIKKVIKDRKTDLNPIWIMRQAGRYLPEFREIRKKNTDFIKLCLNSSLSAEITLQPLKRFDLDAAIIFSDILILPYGLKQIVEFKKNVGPILGDFELVEIACAVAIGSFLPLCHLKEGNVIVDFITAKLSKNKIHLLDSISSFIFGVVAFFFSSRMILGAKDMYVYQEETMLLAFPIWLPFLPVIASFFLLTICCFYTFIIKIKDD